MLLPEPPLSAAPQNLPQPPPVQQYRFQGGTRDGCKCVPFQDPRPRQRSFKRGPKKVHRQTKSDGTIVMVANGMGPYIQFLDTKKKLKLQTTHSQPKLVIENTKSQFSIIRSRGQPTHLVVPDIASIQVVYTQTLGHHPREDLGPQGRRHTLPPPILPLLLILPPGHRDPTP